MVEVPTYPPTTSRPRPWGTRVGRCVVHTYFVRVTKGDPKHNRDPNREPDLLSLVQVSSP